MSPSDNMVERCRQGDPDALAALVEQYGPTILRMLLRYTGNVDQAEELFQETWLRVRVHLKRFRGDARLSTWIYQIALNCARDSRRRQARPIDYERLVREQTAPSPVADAVLDEQLGQLRKAIDELPEAQREAVILSKLQGLSYREMVEITGAPEGTLRSRVHWGLAALRKRMVDTAEP